MFWEHQVKRANDENLFTREIRVLETGVGSVVTLF
jgi:hypothetical protein